MSVHHVAMSPSRGASRLFDRCVRPADLVLRPMPTVLAASAPVVLPAKEFAACRAFLYVAYVLLYRFRSFDRVATVGSLLVRDTMACLLLVTLCSSFERFAYMHFTY